MSSLREERSLGELFSDLTEQTRVLVRQEMSLAKTEVSEKVSGVGKDIGSMVVGVTILYIGVMSLVAALIIGVGHLIGYGLAALVIGAVIAAIGGWLVMHGLNDIKNRNFKPVKTAETLKETKQWAKEQMS